MHVCMYAFSLSALGISDTPANVAYKGGLGGLLFRYFPSFQRYFTYTCRAFDTTPCVRQKESKDGRGKREHVNMI
jgi:hypothetical protein